MATCSGWIADLELPQKVLPLKVQLPGTYVKGSDFLDAADLRRVESVAPAICFQSDGAQIAPDKRERLRMLTEALQLRMSAVAACVAGQDLLRQERFPPQGDEPYSIQVLRVEAPEPHPKNTAGF